MKKLCLFIFMAILCFAASAQAQGVIDVHSHPIFNDYIETIQKHGAGMEEGFPIPTWDAESHIAFMNKAGIETAILTMPAPQPWFGDAAEAAKAARAFNEQCAELKRKYPGRFKYCAALPLPDVENSIKEAIHAFDSLGADCVKIASNSRGLYLGDESLDPLMDVLNSRNAVILTHPHRPDPVNEKIISSVPVPAYEYPVETTRAVLNMLARNVLARYPGIKVVVPHCGSFLPLAIPRMKALLPAMVSRNLMEPINWEDNLKGLYFDLAGTPSPQIIRQLLAITGPSHILYGSDYPYLPADVLNSNLAGLRGELENDPQLSEMAGEILYENAQKLFSRQ